MTTSTPPFAAGLETLHHEVDRLNLSVTGQLPAWLDGILLRNGPAQFSQDGAQLRHWFDGQAMLHRYEFGAGRVSYSNAYLDSPSRRGLTDTGRITHAEFATDPCQSFFSRLFNHFSPRSAPTTNAAVNVIPIGGEIAAVTETPLPVEFDRDTLRTVGVMDYDDDLGGQVTTAHPHVDSDGSLTNYLLSFGRKSRYVVYRQTASSMRREVIATVDTDRPSYMHSFAHTGNHVVLAEFPLVVDPLSFILRDRPFIANYRWRPGRGTRLRVVDLTTRAVTTHRLDEALFAYHHVNAFEDSRGLHMDVVAYDDDSAVTSLYLDPLRAGRAVPVPNLRRITVDLDTGAATCRVLREEALELPRIDPRAARRPHRFVYGTGMRDNAGTDFFNTLVKVDLRDDQTWRWETEGTYPGEPVFVPDPARSADPADEDAGVVLSVVLDATVNKSFLLVLDARDMTELARAYAPHVVPFGFHGGFTAR